MPEPTLELLGQRLKALQDEQHAINGLIGSIIDRLDSIVDRLDRMTNRMESLLDLVGSFDSRFESFGYALIRLEALVSGLKP